jgi:hypothetical protein
MGSFLTQFVAVNESKQKIFTQTILTQSLSQNISTSNFYSYHDMKTFIIAFIYFKIIFYLLELAKQKRFSVFMITTRHTATIMKRIMSMMTNIEKKDSKIKIKNLFSKKLV